MALNSDTEEGALRRGIECSSSLKDIFAATWSLPSFVRDPTGKAVEAGLIDDGTLTPACGLDRPPCQPWNAITCNECGELPHTRGAARLLLRLHGPSASQVALSCPWEIGQRISNWEFDNEEAK